MEEGISGKINDYTRPLKRILPDEYNRSTEFIIEQLPSYEERLPRTIIDKQSLKITLVSIQTSNTT